MKRLMAVYVALFLCICTAFSVSAVDDEYSTEYNEPVSDVITVFEASSVASLTETAPTEEETTENITTTELTEAFTADVITMVTDTYISNTDNSNIVSRLDLIYTLLLVAFSLMVSVFVCWLFYRVVDNFI